MDASALNPSGVVLWNPFEWDILLFILIGNHAVCVPSTTAKSISFCNYKNRKVVGGKHNVLVHYVDVFAPDPSGVVPCNPFKWDILWFILIGNHAVCVPSTTAKSISFCNYKNRKVVGGRHNVLVLYVNVCAPNPFWCCPWKPQQLLFY